MFCCPGNQCGKADQIFFLWDKGIVVTTNQMDLGFKRELWKGAMLDTKESLHNGEHLGTVGAGFAGSF